MASGPSEAAALLAAIRTLQETDTCSGYRAGQTFEDGFVWLCAGPGEIQHFTDGDLQGTTWFFTWDRTHAVDTEKELEIPDGLSTAELAKFLYEKSNEFDES